ncbi:hypothetical protein [Cohnella soli]|uniref:Uncharacterized protein n=1 Tax=Cohnella soli TaxID=425005 RepID=A0ABW0I1I9_9BACL
MNFIVTGALQTRNGRILSNNDGKHRNSIEMDRTAAWCDEFHRYRGRYRRVRSLCTLGRLREYSLILMSDGQRTARSGSNGVQHIVEPMAW